MTFDKKPLTFLYRILRRDLDDLNIVDHRARHLEHGGEDFACEVLKALGNGSNERSPFWHASKSLWLAHEWRTKAEASNGVEPGGGKRVAIRIDIWQWYQSGRMPSQALIDLSHHTEQNNFSRSPLVIIRAIRTTRARL